MMARSPSRSVRVAPEDDGAVLNENTRVEFTGRAMAVGVWTLVVSTIAATLYISSTFYAWASAQDKRLVVIEQWMMSHTKEADERWTALMRQQDRDREEAKEMRQQMLDLLREIKSRS